MSDADTAGTEIEPERDEAEAGAGGLRRAMEQRVKSLQDAEDRIRREQAALQEQAKVVFAEREARLARRERELAKREAALAVSEGIAAGAPLERDKQLEEREEAMRAREQALEQLQDELDARAAQPAEQAPPADDGRVQELEQTVRELEERLATAAKTSAEPGEERSLQARASQLDDREHRTKKVEKVLTQKELHLDAQRNDLLARESGIAEQEQALGARQS